MTGVQTCALPICPEPRGLRGAPRLGVALEPRIGDLVEARGGQEQPDEQDHQIDLATALGEDVPQA